VSEACWGQRLEKAPEVIATSFVFSFDFSYSLCRSFYHLIERDFGTKHRMLGVHMKVVIVIHSEAENKEDVGF
jgi:hypothetical protein